MARLSEHGLRRSVGVPGLFATAYGNVGSSIYYALGLVAGHALGLTPVVFLFAGGLFVLTAKTYAEGAAMFPEAGGSSFFARPPFDHVVSFFAGWAPGLHKGRGAKGPWAGRAARGHPRADRGVGRLGGHLGRPPVGPAGRTPRGPLRDRAGYDVRKRPRARHRVSAGSAWRRAHGRPLLRRSAGGDDPLHRHQCRADRHLAPVLVAGRASPAAGAVRAAPLDLPHALVHDRVLLCAGRHPADPGADLAAGQPLLLRGDALVHDGARGRHSAARQGARSRASLPDAVERVGARAEHPADGRARRDRNVRGVVRSRRAAPRGAHDRHPLDGRRHSRLLPVSQACWPGPAPPLPHRTPRTPTRLRRAGLPHRAGPHLRRRRQRQHPAQRADADRRRRRRLCGLRPARAQPALLGGRPGGGGGAGPRGARERAHPDAPRGTRDPHRPDPHAQPRGGARRGSHARGRGSDLLVDAARARRRAAHRAHRRLPAEQAPLPRDHRDAEPHDARARHGAGARAGLRHDVLEMSNGRLSALPLRGDRPSRPLGVLAAVACVALATALIYPLKQITPVISLGVLYVPAVVVVSTLWGLRFGIATSLLSAAAYNFFHLPPGGHFDLADEREWVALVVFALVAVATGLVADLARVRSRDAEQRRQEADLAAELAQLLLGTAELEQALQLAGDHLAASLGVSFATISLGEEQRVRATLLFSLRSGRRNIGTLCLPAELSEAERARIADRVVPSLQSLLAAALHRAELQASVVDDQALRRSDELKTAVLRSVSHDLRTPLTAILMAATALDAERPSREHVADVREQVLDAATRLGRLIEKLLDLSVLQARHAEPRLVWYSLDEVLHEAIEQSGAQADAFKLSLDSELPLLRGDSAQLERDFANVLENP